MQPHSHTIYHITHKSHIGLAPSVGIFLTTPHLFESGTTEQLHFHFHFHALEKEMATHSSVLAGRIPGTGGLVGCCLWGRTESDTTEATQQQQHLFAEPGQVRSE